MLLSLWMMVQFILVTLVVTFGASLPQSPAQALLFGAAGVLALAPLLTAVVCAYRTVVVPALPQSTTGMRPTPLRSFRVAQDPGTPGAALPRAPSCVVPALG